MSKRLIIQITLSVFVAFGILFSIGIALSAREQVSDLEYDVKGDISDLKTETDDLDGRIDNVEWKLRR